MNMHQAIAKIPLVDLIALFPRQLQPGPVRIFIPAPEGSGASVYPLTVDVARGENRRDVAKRVQDEALQTVDHREVVEVDLQAMFASAENSAN